jgi:hypothetical protein
LARKNGFSEYTRTSWPVNKHLKNMIHHQYSNKIIPHPFNTIIEFKVPNPRPFATPFGCGGYFESTYVTSGFASSKSQSFWSSINHGFEKKKDPPELKDISNFLVSEKKTFHAKQNKQSFNLQLAAAPMQIPTWTNSILNQPRVQPAPLVVPITSPTPLQERMVGQRPVIQNTIHTQVCSQVTGSWTAGPNIIQRTQDGNFCVTFPDTREQIYVPAQNVPVHIQAVAAAPPPPPPPPPRYCGRIHHVHPMDPLHGKREYTDDQCDNCRITSPSWFRNHCNRSF